MVHPLNRLNRLRRKDEGAVAIIVVLLTSIVFVGLSALVVDLGMARDTRRQAQNAADASALAAGNVLYTKYGIVDITSAIGAAKSFAATNYGISAADWAGCTDASALAYLPDAPDTCISFDSATAPTTARVKVPTHQVQTPFARIWGVNSVPVTAAAKIQVIPQGLSVCGLCVIGDGPLPHDIQNGSIDVNGANVAINGTLQSNPRGGIAVTSNGGSIDLTQPLQPTGSGTYTPTPLLSQPTVLDPLAGLVMPDYSSLVAKSNSCTDGPGIYVSLNVNCSPIMAPGLYVLTGTTAMNGTDSIVGTGVTLYTVCSTLGVPRACNVGESGGTITMAGNETLAITAPTSGPDMGVAIVADRNNTATFSLRGTVSSGAIYLASGTLDFRGNVGGSYNSQVVVGDISFNGTVTLTLNDATGAGPPVPPIGLHLSQ
jgi:Flp pilus assembly protein TadG